MADKKRTTAELIEVGNRHNSLGYRAKPIVFERGEGVYLFDREGRRYLDWLGGIAVNCLGGMHEECRRSRAREGARQFARHSARLADPTHNPPAPHVQEQLAGGNELAADPVGNHLDGISLDAKGTLRLLDEMCLSHDGACGAPAREPPHARR